MSKLRVLFVSHGVLDNDSGVARVHYELKQAYEKAGCHVDKVDVGDLFPNGINFLQKFRFGSAFTLKVYGYLKKNAFKYDIIDSNYTNIIYPKEAFGFKGIVFARSHGIMPFYENLVKTDVFKKQVAKGENILSLRKRTIGFFFRSFCRDLNISDFYASVKYADILHCLNQSEYQFFIDLGISKDRLALIPNGLPKKYLDTFNTINQNRANAPKTVAFIGAWHYTKGIKDWKEISAGLIKIRDFKNIKILGSVMPEDYVKQDFDSIAHNSLKIKPRFKPEELPALLKDVKVGVFTSYMEGFGYAVLEQLAAGIPVVAYNVPGVADMLNQVDPTLLIETGNVESLVDKVRNVINMNDDTYESLSNACIKIAKEYTLEKISLLYLQLFEHSLKLLHEGL